MNRNEINNKSRHKNYDTVQILLPKGQRDFLKSIAQEQGLSLNQLILRCLYTPFYCETIASCERNEVLPKAQTCEATTNAHPRKTN